MLHQRAQTHLEEGDPKMSECWTGGPADAYLCVVKKPEPEGACGGMDAYLSPLEVWALTQSNQTGYTDTSECLTLQRHPGKVVFITSYRVKLCIKCKLEGGVNESLACKGKGKRTNTGPRC